MPPEPLKTDPRGGSRNPALLLVSLLVLAFGLRLISALNDFWLDEIWSLQAVERLHSAAEVLTAYRSDNNHPLNSWVLYFLRGDGSGGGWLAYRIPAVLAGTASVAVAWWLARAAIASPRAPAPSSSRSTISSSTTRQRRAATPSSSSSR